MTDEIFKAVIDLVGTLALLWTGVTLIRIAKRFAGSNIPPPFNADLDAYKTRRKWRDGSSLVCAAAGLGLIAMAALHLVSH
jgi:hypothetical protein